MLSHSSDSDARKAMTKDKHNMQHRYVELFYGDTGNVGAGGDGGNRRGGGGGGGYYSQY